MMEVSGTSETLVNFYQTTRRYNPEDSHLRLPFVCKFNICVAYKIWSSHGDRIRWSLLKRSRASVWSLRNVSVYSIWCGWFFWKPSSYLWQLIKDFMSVSVLISWAVTPCGLVSWYQRLGGTYCLHLQLWRWTVCFSDIFTAVRTSKLTSCLRKCRLYRQHEDM
jgi:hypothetical protein